MPTELLGANNLCPSRLKRLPRVLLSQENRDCNVPYRLTTSGRVVRSVPVIRDMCMGVDQAGNVGISSEIYDLRIHRNFVPSIDALNSVVLDNHSDVNNDEA